MTFEELQTRLAAPARRALAAHGVDGLASLAQYGASEIAGWHGIGKSAMAPIRAALSAYRTVCCVPNPSSADLSKIRAPAYARDEEEEAPDAED